jgi:hypothetical protein
LRKNAMTALMDDEDEEDDENDLAASMIKKIE